MRRNTLIFLILFLPVLGFSLPFSSDFHITSSFGEYRGNTLHMGVDLIPVNSSDTAVYAIESGHLYRLKNERFGYGKAVYIKNNDLTFVYAHLDSFAQKFIYHILMDKWLKQGIIYGDYYFDRTAKKVFVEKGEFLGYMGSSGVLTGDHLHLEIRKDDTIAINPMPFINFSDNTNPNLSDMLFVSYHGDRFLSPGIYDLTSRRNKLGIHSIYIDENRMLSFDFIDYKDYRTGRDIYNFELTSFSKYFYRIPINKNYFTVTFYDFANNSVQESVYIPDNVFEMDNIVYNYRKEQIEHIELQDRFDDRCKDKINISAKSDKVKYNVFMKNNNVHLNISPLFTGSVEFVEIETNFAQKEGLYSLRNNRTSYVSDNSKIRLFAGEYIVLTDNIPPYYMRRPDTIHFGDDLSGLDYNSIKGIYDGKDMVIERDFNVCEKGKLEVYFKASQKIIITLSDKAGNKRTFELDPHLVHFRTTPFFK